MNKKSHRLTSIIEAFSNITKIPVTYYNNQWDIIWENFREYKFCSIFSCNCDCHQNCLKTLQDAARTSTNLNEPYIFVCAANFTNIAFPSKDQHQYPGYFFLGPIPMGHSKEKLVENLIKKIQPDQKNIPRIINFISNTEIKTPAEVSYTYDVFCSCVLPYNILDNNFGLISEKKADSHYTDTIGQDLAYAVRTGNHDVARETFRLFYEKTYLIEAGSFHALKLRTIELFNTLSRVVTDRTTISFIYIEEIETIHGSYSFTDIYKNSLAFIERLTTSCAEATYHGSSSVIKEALDYINTYYNLSITLTSAAEKVAVNPSYLSTLFKKEVGKNFSEYLLDIRLENSLKLILNTHMSITDIAMDVGMSNQSYFIKQFKIKYGMTPGEYRKRLTKA